MRVFPFFVLLILVGLMQAYQGFRAHFSEEKYLREQLSVLEKNHTKLQMKSQLVRYQYSEFKQNVAEHIPSAMKTQSFSYNLRNIASFVDNAEPITMEPASELFHQGKKLYDQQNFEEASAYFKRLSSIYTESIHLPESLFMLAESYYQIKDFERSMDAIEYLVEQFPEHILTGYSLIRLGKIYEKHERTEDAIMAYSLIRTRFQQKELLAQATAMLEGLK